MSDQETQISLVEFSNPLALPKAKNVRPVAFKPGLTCGEVASLARIGGPTVILRNNEIVDDPNTRVLPGDIIHVLPYLNDARQGLLIAGMLVVAAIAFFIVGPAVTAALPGAIASVGGVTVTGAGVGAMATMATMVAGGLLLNALLPPPEPHSEEQRLRESPTYGFTNAVNLSREGLPIPVNYGTTAIVPPIIGFYLSVPSRDTMTAHILLLIGEGKSNTLVGAGDIYANEEPLDIFDEYEVECTDGSTSPDSSQLSDFRRLHQYRTFRKALSHKAYETIYSLLHFDGPDGSTSIVDDSEVQTNNWTCYGGAELNTDEPMFGSANLRLGSSVADYVECDNENTWNFFNAGDLWDLEFWFTFEGSLESDMGIIGQQWIETDVAEYYWGLFYNMDASSMGQDALVFQAWKREKNGSWSDTVYWNLAVPAAGFVPGGWNHIRVAKYVDTIYIYIDGSRVGYGAYQNAPENPEDGLGSVYTVSQQIGIAYWYNEGTPELWDAVGEIDELRLLVGQLAYPIDPWNDADWTFAPPDAAYETPDIATFRTRGSIDRFTMLFEASLGLYTILVDAQGIQTMETMTVEFTVYHKIVGGSEWTETTVQMSGRSHYAVRKEETINVSERGQYDIKVVRRTPDSPEMDRQDRTWWIGLDEILDERLLYPGLQVCQISITAQENLTVIPTFKVIARRTEIEVPDMAGGADQTVDPTIPPWVAYDMITNEWYGAGKDPIEEIEQDEWEDWIDWNAETVGGEQRCQFNMTFDTASDLEHQLQVVENVARGRLVRRGIKVGVAIEKPTSATMMFVEDGNIIAGTGKLQFLRQSEVADGVQITYRNPDLAWKRDAILVKSSDFDTLTRVPRIVRLEFPMITSLDHATREGILRLQLSQAAKRATTFEASTDAIRLVTGDVYRYSSGGNPLEVSGRLASDLDGTTVKVDKEVTLDSSYGDHKIYIRTAADDLLLANIVSPFDEETDEFVIDSSLEASKFDVFMICRSTQPSLYRAISIQRTSQQFFTIRGLFYDEDAYYHSDYGSEAI